MLFQQSNSTPCIKEQLEEEGHRWWWRMRHRCEEHEALIVTTEVEWSRLSWSYSVAQGKQLLPLTQTHTRTHTRNTDLINSPGKGAASEQASVTHSSKNKLGSCENKAWEPWNLGAVEGWDLQLYAEQRGRSRTSSGGQGNTEWQVLRQRVGGRVYSQSGPSTLEQRTQCACPACCVSYYKPRPGGLKPAWDRSYQEIVKKKKKLPLLFLNIHIHCDLDATGKRVYERIQLHINNTKGCLPAPQENAEFNLRIKYGGTPHARGPSHFVSSCVQLEPWLTSPWCKLALLPSSPAERKQRLLKKHREKALLKSLPTDVISDLRTMLFSANHPWRSPIRPFYFIWLFFLSPV